MIDNKCYKKMREREGEGRGRVTTLDSKWHIDWGTKKSCTVSE